jgi:signal transduction histidine kinase
VLGGEGGGGSAVRRTTPPSRDLYAERVSDAIGALAVVPAVTAATAGAAAVVLAATGRPARRVWPARLAAAAGAVSVAATAAFVAAPPDYGEVAGWAGIGECAALLALVVVVTRWAPRRHAVVAVAVAGVAVAVCVLRFLPADSVLDVVGACALWAGGPAVAVVIGGYPRLAEARRRGSVAVERRAQRLALARDLHDFVAHDVSGIVALAQAARFVAGTDPARALDALARVEEAGLRALDTMDRTVAMLGDLAGPPGAAPGLDDLPALLHRFDGPSRLTFDLAAPDGVPADVGATAYRVVREALTNVHRHAPAATAVSVVVSRTPDPALTVTVTNDAPAAVTSASVTSASVTLDRGNPGGSCLDRSSPGSGTPGSGIPASSIPDRGSPNHGTPGGGTPGNGTGLADLRHRAHLLGGTLRAGPYDDGWRVTAVLPLERP